MTTISWLHMLYDSQNASASASTSLGFGLYLRYTCNTSYFHIININSQP
jgi:hypothetical protein